MAGALRHVKGVVSVQGRQVEEGLSSYEVRTTEDEDLREGLYQAVQHKGWAVRRLGRKRRRVEDAFFDVLRAQDPLKQSETGRPITEAITRKE